MGNFRELKVWQRAKDLAVFIYTQIEHSYALFYYITEGSFSYIEKEC